MNVGTTTEEQRRPLPDEVAYAEVAQRVHGDHGIDEGGFKGCEPPRTCCCVVIRSASRIGFLIEPRCTMRLDPGLSMKWWGNPYPPFINVILSRDLFWS